ncbi:MAG TPA: protein kinase [Gemmatimonadales bacterium]|jgi:serine/threonine-protein kinase|nr:protein kinase [Gemmatimonadales bacterium]
MSDVPDSIREALRGRYRIERLLGEGGMATVYLAQDERHDRRVAVKVLRPELAATIGVERFNREIGIAARLNHPHILPLLDSGTLDLGQGRPASVYYVMPFVEGESLRDRLLREGKLPVPVALRLAREIADALDHAHRHGVIHRDIKPENILLSEQHAVVADFGIARALDQASAGSITHTGQAIGTPTYMSPEQVTGERVIDGRTDLYALGCTLFEMLSGQPPWSGGTMSSLVARRLAEPPPRVRTLEPSVSPAVEKALLKALAREPEQRFNTPAEFAAALETTGSQASLAIPRGRRRAVLLVAAALLAVGIFGLTQLVGVGHADTISSIALAPSALAVKDSSIGYLTEGIQGEVANLLRRLPQLRVTAPSVVAQLQRQQPDLSYLQLGEKLKVAAVLTWDLTTARDSVVVSSELLRIPGGDLLWSLRYAQPRSELATLQGTLARMVSDSLRLQLTGVEYATMTRRPTSSAEAYDLYLRGQQLYLRAGPLNAANARLLADSSVFYTKAAIAIDPNFAEPQGLLATLYFVRAFRGWGPFAEYMDSSAAVGRRAFALDSTLGDPWVNMITRAIYLDDDWTTARAASERALRAASHDPQVLIYSGIVFGEVEGQLDTAIALARRGVEQQPVTLFLNTLGDLYMRAGKYDSAVSVLRRALEFDPSVPGPRRRLIMSLEHLKRYDEAIGARRQGGDSAGAAAYARALADAGPAGYERIRREDLERQLAALLVPVSRPYKLPDDTVPQLREEKIAERYALLGEWSKAMDWVLAEYSHRPRRFRLFVTNPLYRGLDRDPRFLPLVRKEKLEAIYRG